MTTASETTLRSGDDVVADGYLTKVAGRLVLNRYGHYAILQSATSDPQRPFTRVTCRWTSHHVGDRVRLGKFVEVRGQWDDGAIVLHAVTLKDEGARPGPQVSVPSDSQLVPRTEFGTRGQLRATVRDLTESHAVLESVGVGTPAQTPRPILLICADPERVLARLGSMPVWTDCWVSDAGFDHAHLSDAQQYVTDRREAFLLQAQTIDVGNDGLLRHVVSVHSPTVESVRWVSHPDRPRRVLDEWIRLRDGSR